MLGYGGVDAATNARGFLLPWRSLLILQLLSVLLDPKLVHVHIELLGELVVACSRRDEVNLLWCEQWHPNGITALELLINLAP